jgi:glutamate racemase
MVPPIFPELPALTSRQRPVARRPRVAVFDSGVGGLSVLRALQCVLPQADLRYLADAAHAPYGERDESDIAQLSQRMVERLADPAPDVIVLACNTATAAAATALRRRWAPIPIVGVEPGLKPALAATRNGRIGVMATAATLRSNRFRALLARHGDGMRVHLQACDGLAQAVERSEDDQAALQALVQQHCAPLLAVGVDTVVLGCTHYPFAGPLIQAEFGPGVTLVDTSDAVARQVVHVLADAGLPCLAASAVGAAGAPPVAWLETSGDVPALRRFARRWLPFAHRVSSTGDSPDRTRADGADGPCAMDLP